LFLEEKRSLTFRASHHCMCCSNSDCYLYFFRA